MTRLIYLLLLLLPAFGVTSCVTTTPDPAQWLPAGVYHHDVAVFQEGHDPQRFSGILKIEGDDLSMVMLSAFGLTLARITDQLHADNAHFEIYADDMKPYEAKLRVIFQALKPAFVDTAATSASVYGRPMTISHEGIVPPGVPKVTTIAGEGLRMTVEVTGYENPPR